MTTKEIQDYVWNWCLNHGLNEKATAGIMGNISQECSWISNEIEAGNGIGFGLIQWSFERRTQLEAFGTDEEHQMYFMWSEMTGYYPETGANKQWINTSNYNYQDFYNGVYTPSQSASAFCWCFERPNVNQANEAFRQSEAERFYSIYSGSVSVAPPPFPNPPPSVTGSVYMKLITTSYILNQLSDSQLTFIKTLNFSDTVKIKFTYDRRKYNGVNFTGKRLTIDDNSYIIVDVENNGFIKITTSLDNKCYKFVNPSLIKGV